MSYKVLTDQFSLVMLYIVIRKGVFMINVTKKVFNKIFKNILKKELRQDVKKNIKDYKQKERQEHTK